MTSSHSHQGLGVDDAAERNPSHPFEPPQKGSHSMSQYLPHLLVFAMVLCPLYIPTAVTIVHTIRKWRPTLPSFKFAIRRERTASLSSAGGQLSAEAA